jgi:hypothetical protein
VVRSCLCWCVWLWCFVVDCGSSEIGNLCVYVAVAVFGCGVLLLVAGVLEISVVPNETTRPLFVDFYYFLVKKGKCFKLYV